MNHAWAMGQISVQTPPADLVMSVSDVREHLHIDGVDDDPLLERLIRAATERFDGPHGLGWALQTQRWQWILTDWPCHTLENFRFPLHYYYDNHEAFALPGHPVTRLISVEHLTDDTTFTAVAGASLLQSLAPEEPSLIWRDGGWPELGSSRPYGIKIIYELGLASTAIPEELKLAMLMTIGQWYQAREGLMEPMAQLPAGVRRIMSRYRDMVGRFG